MVWRRFGVFQWTASGLVFKIKMKPYLTSATLAHELFCDITIFLTDTYLPLSS